MWSALRDECAASSADLVTAPYDHVDAVPCRFHVSPKGGLYVFDPDYGPTELAATTAWFFASSRTPKFYDRVYGQAVGLKSPASDSYWASQIEVSNGMALRCVKNM
jgi:hypothetical protein